MERLVGSLRVRVTRADCDRPFERRRLYDSTGPNGARVPTNQRAHMKEISIGRASLELGALAAATQRRPPARVPRFNFVPTPPASQAQQSARHVPHGRWACTAVSAPPPSGPRRGRECGHPARRWSCRTARPARDVYPGRNLANWIPANIEIHSRFPWIRDGGLGWKCPSSAARAGASRFLLYVGDE